MGLTFAAPSTATVPATAQAAFDRGRAFYDQRNYDAAIREFTEAIRIDPNFAAAYRNRGMAYERKGDTVRANADYAKRDELRR